MRRPISTWLAAFAAGLLLVPAILDGAEPARPPVAGGQGRVTQVTLYRGQAQVTRELTVDGPVGPTELVVDGLPEQIDAASLFGEGTEQVEVRAVRFRSQAVQDQPREDVRAVEEEIQGVQDLLALNQKSLEIVAKQLQYLDGLDLFVTPIAKEELLQGSLNAEALQQVTKFTFEQRESIAKREVELTKEQRTLQAQVQTLQRRLAELTQGAERSVREAVLFLEKRAAGPQTVRLTYLVNGCGWSPSYTLRATAGQAQLRIEYNALIQQVSGENWSDVSLTLSTATPGLSAAGPGLAPFRVALSAGQQQQQVAGKEQLAQQVDSIVSRQNMALVQTRNAYRIEDNLDTAWAVNGIANELQCLELNTSAPLLGSLQRGQTDEGPSISYVLDGPVSLASRSDQQIVRIVQSDIPSRFYHVATPVLSTFVYREAEVSNDSQEDLLGGQANIYLDGRFVGRTELPTVARGQTFVVGFGIDPQLRTRRELADRTDEVQGGNRQLGFAYRLVVENFKGEAVDIRLLDRLPTTGSEDIQVTLGESDSELSKDPLYVRLERPQGLLRWDIEVPANAAGETAKLLQYRYAVEYDRQFALTAANASPEQQQQEFEQLLKQRLKR